MFEFDYRGEGALLPAAFGSVDWFDRRAVYVAAIVGFLVNLNALFIPIFRLLTGGLVAGFVAGYAAGRPDRGVVQGAVAAGLAGLGSAVVPVLTGWLIGMFVEPPALLLRVVGPVSPTFTPLGGLGFPLLYLAIAAAVALDGLAAGAIGGCLNSLVYRAAGRR